MQSGVWPGRAWSSSDRPPSSMAPRFDALRWGHQHDVVPGARLRRLLLGQRRRHVAREPGARPLVGDDPRPPVREPGGAPHVVPVGVAVDDDQVAVGDEREERPHVGRPRQRVPDDRALVAEQERRADGVVLERHLSHPDPGGELLDACHGHILAYPGPPAPPSVRSCRCGSPRHCISVMSSSRGILPAGRRARLTERAEAGIREEERPWQRAPPPRHCPPLPAPGDAGIRRSRRAHRHDGGRGRPAAETGCRVSSSSTTWGPRT